MSHDPLVAEGAMQPPVRQQRGFWNMGSVSVLMKLSDGWLPQPFSEEFSNGSVMVSLAERGTQYCGHLAWRSGWRPSHNPATGGALGRDWTLGDTERKSTKVASAPWVFFRFKCWGCKNINNIESIKKHQKASKYTVLRKGGLWTRCPLLNESYPFGTLVPHGLHAFTFRWGGSPRIRWNAMWNPSWQLESTSRSFILAALCPLTVGRTKAFAFMIIYAPFQLRLN